MQGSSAAASPLPRVLLWVHRLTLLGLASLAALVLGLGLFVCGARVVYAGRPLPGVRVGGVDVSGQSQAMIAAIAAQSLTYPQTGLIVLHDGERVWAARPEELGLAIDPSATSAEAVAIGRRGAWSRQLREQFAAWGQGVSVPPVVLLDEGRAAAYLAGLAQAIDQPAVEASLSLDGLDVVIHPGQVGRALDIPMTLEVLRPSLTGLSDADLPLVVRESPPRILDVSQQAALARRILSAPLTLTAEGAGPWVFQPGELAPRLRFEVVDSSGSETLQVGMDPQALADFLLPLAPSLERKPQNARFIFNDDTRKLDLLAEAVTGRALDLAATLQAVNTGLRNGQHEIGLAFKVEEPAVRSDATAEQLGITENVVSATTYFSGSSPERIQNIKTAAAEFHGLLVAPGETLSMADHLGDISIDSGYAEALIIYGNRTIKGVGGGVCQVSTTLFRAAFFGGYPIVERYPHAYRVLYYEQGPGEKGNPNRPGPGLDATVFVPLVDFKFTNDTPSWLLMETYVYGESLLWKFYSTSDGRTVEWSSSGPKNVKEAPEPLYRENDELKKGKIKQVDYEADGMDVTVYRTVRRGGEVLYDDVIKTRYLPWRAIYEFGPGTDLPDDAKIEGKDD
jgi:vancomycin resistance protein YoaR